MKRFLTTLVTLLTTAMTATAAVKTTPWGKTADGQPVQLFEVTSPALTITFTNYGAHVVSVLAPDRHGKKADVILGYKDIAGYEADKSTYLGAIVGRYGNRLAKGTFSIDGKTFHIPANNGENALHGGPLGFDTKVWKAKAIENGVEFTLVSPDGDMGFPGTLTSVVRYTLHGAALHIDYTATTDKATVVNLTNHAYFNLAGEASGTILGQVMMINADAITPVDAGLIPTGVLMPVAGTPFDFTQPMAIGARINTPNEQLKLAGGYDHNFVLKISQAPLPNHASPAPKLHLAAKAVDPASGRTLTVTTTEPGVQFYSGNFLAGKYTSVSGKPYEKYDGFCLETQHFPDSPNRAAFPSTLLKPGQTMHSSTVFTFGVE